MTKIILDPNLRHQLPDLSQPFAVCDEVGNVLGRFIPTAMDPPLSRAEIERRKQNKGKTHTRRRSDVPRAVDSIRAR